MSALMRICLKIFFLKTDLGNPANWKSNKEQKQNRAYLIDSIGKYKMLVNENFFNSEGFTERSGNAI
jgi:hypothetical protein